MDTCGEGKKRMQRSREAQRPNSVHLKVPPAQRSTLEKNVTPSFRLEKSISEVILNHLIFFSNRRKYIPPNSSGCLSCSSFKKKQVIEYMHSEEECPLYQLRCVALRVLASVV
jgi:hypothetical protein